MRLLIAALCLSAPLAHAVDSQQLEDTCFAKIKPLIKDKAAKVTGVKTTPPQTSRRNSVWHVTFDFNRKLRNDNDTAHCMFKTDGTLWSRRPHEVS